MSNRHEHSVTRWVVKHSFIAYSWHELSLPIHNNNDNNNNILHNIVLAPFLSRLFFRCASRWVARLCSRSSTAALALHANDVFSWRFCCVSNPFSYWICTVQISIVSNNNSVFLRPLLLPLLPFFRSLYPFRLSLSCITVLPFEMRPIHVS